MGTEGMGTDTVAHSCSCYPRHSLVRPVEGDTHTLDTGVQREWRGYFRPLDVEASDRRAYTGMEEAIRKDTSAVWARALERLQEEAQIEMVAGR